MGVAVEPLLPLTEPAVSLAHHRDNGGGAGLAEARRIGPADVIAEVRAAGLRGRGGAGVPTATKWAGVHGTEPVYLVCNAAEGELGTFKDRFILRRNAYQMLEGLAIAAYALGATRAFICVKRTFHTEIAALCMALNDLRDANLLGPVPIQLVLGPDEYLFGEEKAMAGVIERGKPQPAVPAPRSAPNRVVVNNVETLAHVPGIIRLGANSFRAAGTDGSPGTTVFTLSGDVRRPGLYELPLGVPLRMLIELVGAGVPGDRRVKAVFSGAFAAPLTGALLDVPLDYDSVRAAGSALGSAGLVVYDESTCMVAAALAFCRFLAVESGCKSEIQEITDRLDRIERGDGTETDLDTLRAKCGTGTARLVRGVLDSFGHEFTAHLGRPCPLPRDLPVPKLTDFDELTNTFTYDKRYQPDWSYLA
ncbi:MAG TPA: SLBB domain-containing protein [Pseudonocardiaceae bacterium]|nr:SLBB domain-containing protein [Pseudonocardiaceae bacterium]